MLVLKVAFWLIENGLTVLIAACDTFRAGAVEQLRTHTRKLNTIHSPADHGGRQMVQLFDKGYDKDAASVAMSAIAFGKVSVLIVSPSVLDLLSLFSLLSPLTFLSLLPSLLFLLSLPPCLSLLPSLLAFVLPFSSSYFHLLCFFPLTCLFPITSIVSLILPFFSSLIYQISSLYALHSVPCRL